MFLKILASGGLKSSRWIRVPSRSLASQVYPCSSLRSVSMFPRVFQYDEACALVGTYRDLPAAATECPDKSGFQHA